MKGIVSRIVYDSVWVQLDGDCEVVLSLTQFPEEEPVVGVTRCEVDPHDIHPWLIRVLPLCPRCQAELAGGWWCRICKACKNDTLTQMKYEKEDAEELERMRRLFACDLKGFFWRVVFFVLAAAVVIIYGILSR